MIVVAINGMQRFHGALGAEVAAAGAQVVVVEVPDHGRPRVVEHPLNNAGGLVFVAAVSLVHGAHALVGLHLRLRGEVFHVVRLAIAIGERRGEHADGFEFATAVVIVPGVVDGPHMIFAHHGADTLDRRNGRSHAGFGVKAVSAAAASRIALLAFGLSLRSVHFPVARRHVFIGARHLDSAVASHAGLLSGS